MATSPVSACAPSSLRFYLDTAKVEDWQRWLPTGIFYGVTTNPLLLERAGVSCTIPTLKGLIHQALEMGMQEVQVQTWGESVSELVENGLRLAAIDRQQRLLVKVPITEMGAAAAYQLVSAKVRVTMTAVYEVHQVLLAVALKAEQAAPYLGRITDLGRDGRADLVAMQRAVRGVDSSMRLLVASIRQIEDIPFLAAEGLNTFTVSAAIAEALFNGEATEKAVVEFERAARVKGEE